MSIRMIYDLVKWYKNKQKGETKEKRPQIDPETAYKALCKYQEK